MRITDDLQNNFQNAAITLPAKSAGDTVKWAHFGGGNLFRGFHMEIAQELLDTNEEDSGILLLETFDPELIEKIYVPNANRALKVELSADGSGKIRLLDSVAAAYYVNAAHNFSAVREYFVSPQLQMVTLSITEKGYQLRDMHEQWFPYIQAEMEGGPAKAQSAMAVLVSLLYERFQNGALPLALVSTDNFSHNGDKLKDSVCLFAESWIANGFLEAAFRAYLSDESKITFPWSMIDRITPNPAPIVQESLEKSGWQGMEIIRTQRNSVSAAFVNTEATHYLVIEDRFPNGRPALEKAGVILTDRETVDRIERMKVCTCLNPLHTSLAIFGCLLGFEYIWQEMQDEDLSALVRQIGYVEGLPVVVNPGVINPKSFLTEVIEKRLTNPHIPDMPQRIATDTSQKLPIRFGNTIKAYLQSDSLQTDDLHFITLTLAAWLRYLMGIDDNGEPMTLSSDPMLENLQSHFTGISLGDNQPVDVTPILSNSNIFGVNLVQAGLADSIIREFNCLRTAPGAVRKRLHEMIEQYAGRLR